MAILVEWLKGAGSVMGALTMFVHKSGDRFAIRLRDIGKTRAQALAEAAKPFWRA